MFSPGLLFYSTHGSRTALMPLDVKGMTLRKLNELAEQTSRFMLQSITNRQARSILVQNYHDELTTYAQ